MAYIIRMPIQSLQALRRTYIPDPEAIIIAATHHLAIGTAPQGRLEIPYALER